MLAGDPALTPIAGCTDVYVGLHFGTMQQRRFIDLWDLKELRGIKDDGGVLRIGALTTYAEIIASKLAQKRVPMLVAASREVGGAQIQNRGTLGGNVANASPAGDTLPVLAAANARVVLRSHSTTRTVPFDAFYTGLTEALRPHDVGVTVVRPGFVHTRMTEGMKPAPLSTTPEVVAAAAVDAVRNRREQVWVPAPLRGVMSVLRHLPRPVFRRLPA